MTQVLFIAYEFPPVNSGGSARPYKFCKHLPNHGIDPLILTVQPALQSGSVDTNNSSKTIDNLKIFRTRISPKSKWSAFTSETYYLNIVDDTFKRWKRYFLAELDKIMKEHRPLVIFVTAPPFSIVDCLPIIKKKYQLPVILDLRDAWSLWNTTPYASKLHYLLTKSREKKSLQYADLVLTTSDQTRLDLINLHKNENLASKIHTIANSFDTPILEPSIKVSQKATINIRYVGSFYFNEHSHQLMFSKWWQKKPYQWFQFSPRKENWLYRTPHFFFLAIQKLIAEKPEWESRIQIEFAGKTPEWLKKMVESMKLQRMVKFVGWLSKDKSMRFQQEADYLLLTSSKVEGGRDYSIAGKTFEYFNTMKPIISFVCQGAQKDILKSSGLSLICDPDDSLESSRSMSELFESKIKLTPDIPFIQKYSSSSTTQQLAKLITSII